MRNLETISGPKVKDTPLSLSLQPIVSLSGSAHSRSHSSPAQEHRIGWNISRTFSTNNYLYAKGGGGGCTSYTPNTYSKEIEQFRRLLGGLIYTPVPLVFQQIRYTTSFHDCTMSHTCSQFTCTHSAGGTCLQHSHTRCSKLRPLLTLVGYVHRPHDLTNLLH